MTLDPNPGRSRKASGNSESDTQFCQGSSVPTLEQNDVQFALEVGAPSLSVSWRVAPCPYASGTSMKERAVSRLTGPGRSAPDRLAFARVRAMAGMGSGSVIYDRPRG
jgi:hypothetical protein